MIIGQIYIPLQVYGKGLISDIDEVINGHRIVVKDFRVAYYEDLENRG